MSSRNETTAVLEDLVEILEDGRKGFEMASERLADDGFDIASGYMSELSAQRRTFSQQLKTAAGARGMEIDSDGSVGGTLRRGWMAVRDTLSSDQDAYAILAVAEESEDQALAAYRNALRTDLGDLRPVIEAQSEQIKDAHDRVKMMRDAEKESR